MRQKNDIGIIGLGVMGKALALNCADKNLSVSAFNRDDSRENNEILKFLTELDNHQKISYFKTISEFVESLSTPRKIILLVSSGSPVDFIISDLKSFLECGDIIIDAGNSNYIDSRRRFLDLESHQIHFLGCGISGGESGARLGPSIMVGGEKKAFEKVRSSLELISCKNRSKESCCNLIGLRESGHIVKSIHNGIEYCIMQLISEIFSITNLFHENCKVDSVLVLEKILKSDNDNYLLKITNEILKNYSYEKINKISDVAQQKGSGKDVIRLALDVDCPCHLISYSVFNRTWSSFKKERESCAKIYKPSPQKLTDEMISVEDLIAVFEFCSFLAFAEGTMLLSKASQKLSLEIDIKKVFKTWSNGTIIRGKMVNFFEKFESYENIYSSKQAFEFLEERLLHVEKIFNYIQYIDQSIGLISLCYQFYKTLKSNNMPTNLIQAQRDFFGNHGFYLVTDHSKIHHLKDL